MKEIGPNIPNKLEWAVLGAASLYLLTLSPDSPPIKSQIADIPAAIAIPIPTPEVVPKDCAVKTEIVSYDTSQYYIPGNEHNIVSHRYCAVPITNDGIVRVAVRNACLDTGRGNYFNGNHIDQCQKEDK